MYFCTYEPSNPTYYILLKYVFVFFQSYTSQIKWFKVCLKVSPFYSSEFPGTIMLVVYLPLWKMWVSWGYDLPNIWKVIKFHGSSHHQAHHKSALGSAWDFEGTASHMLGPKWMAMPGRRWHGQGVVHGIDDETWCSNLRGIEHLVLFWPVFFFTTNEWSAWGCSLKWVDFTIVIWRYMGPTALPRNLGWLPSLLMERSPLVGLKRSNEQHHMSSLWMLSDM